MYYLLVCTEFLCYPTDDRDGSSRHSLSEPSNVVVSEKVRLTFVLKSVNILNMFQI